ncbi:hypothetical protein F2Q69_00007696 [Brassica cretica]|uniref:Uncharacterized protein n=1 Tax=Brassica cretica TaxID=69181 RepID=A0A8S9P4U4_BRACR|nr:hypothetical protein F2Q69_00007696 [Brassica cretica]
MSKLKTAQASFETISNRTSVPKASKKLYKTKTNCNDPISQAQQGPISLQETLGEFLCKQSQPIILFRKSLRRPTAADLEPSEKDIGELSQPPSTEIRSVTPPPFHPLGNPQTTFSDWLSAGRLVNCRYLSNHWVSRDFKATSVFVTLRRVWSRSISPRTAATRPHAQEEVSRLNRTHRHLRQTFAGATAAGHHPFAAGKPPPHRRRVSAAAGDFPVSHHRCWPPPATGLRRLAGRLTVMSRDYVSGRGSRDVWTSDAALVGGGSETSGLATQIVWGVGAETFAFDAALEGGGTETDYTSDATYASWLFMLELNFHSGSSIYSNETDEQG